jgi:serine/threonine protein kinase
MSATTEDLFAAALSLPASERDYFLGRACADASEQYAQLRSLLNDVSSSAAFVKESYRSPISGAVVDNYIDNYRIVEELGEGGGGVVYLAEQVAPIKRELALKILKLGMDTRAVINRFDAERQALAMMDHPNIAKVFAAGATPAGRPYFVMELVRGIRITDYCNHCRLTIAERLELFIQVCNAIEHAHQQHIVHRDIKPSNVLVTLHAGVPLAKVIDFGVAKATHGRLTDETLFTLVDQFIGTPAYISPEQTGLDASNVDARSDIYSLGVLLYELLTNCTPLDPRDLAGQTLEEVRRRIREETPARPSKRLCDLDLEVLKACAVRCGAKASRLLQEIRGDLDWIVMRCLEKDKARRYRSAGDLSADINRRIENLPVLARPPSLIYFFRRFAARHRAVIIAITIVVNALLVATSVSTWQAVRAKSAEARALQERENAEQVSRFLLDMFGAIDPYGNLGQEPLARDLLDQAALSISSESTADLEVRARLLEGIGRSYRRINEPDQAAVHLREALQLRQGARADSSSVGALLVELAIVVREQGYLAESDRLSADALRLLSQSKEQRSLAQADLFANLGALEILRGHPVESIAYTSRCIELLRELKGWDSPEVGFALAEISGAKLWNDDFDGAEQASREALKILETLPTAHPGRIGAIYQLGEVLFYRGKIAEATDLFERALTLDQRRSSTSVVTVNVLGSLAQVRILQGRMNEAEHLVMEALQVYRASKRVDRSKYGYLQTMLAMVWIKRRNFSDAERLLRDTIDFLSLHLPNHLYIASAEHYLGEVLLAQNKYREAERRLRSAIDRWKQGEAPAWRSARSENLLGQVLHELKQDHEAEHHLVESFRVLMANAGVDEETKQVARERVHRFFEETEQTEKFAALLVEVPDAGTVGTVQARAAIQ